MVEVKPINISLNQHSPSLSVRTAISPTLTEEFIIHPSVYSEIKKLGHAKSDVLLSESGSSLSADCGVSFPNISVSNVIENSSYDLSHVKNFNTRNDSSSLIKDYKCNKIKITKLKLSIVREKCSDIVLCKKANGAMKTSSVEFISRSPNPLPMKSEHRRFVLLRKIFEPWQWKRRKKRNRFEQTSRTLQRKISMRSTKDQLVKKDVLMPVKNNVFLWNLPDVEESLSVPFFFVCFRFSSGLHGSTAADSVQSEWPLWHAAKSKTQVFARRRIELKLKQKLLDIRAEKGRSSEGERERVVAGCVANVGPTPFDYVGDQKRMVLLPEEVGEKGFLKSCSPTFRIDSSRKGHARGPVLRVRMEAEGRNFGLAIHQNDHQARRRFVEWAQNEIAVVPDLHKRILFSDEAHFWLNGYVNKQNCRIWSEANPQVYVETPLHPEKLIVWCALWAGGIIGPYFFKNDESHYVTVNGDRYRAMITNFFIPELNNHDVQELWFQQDGTTCHTARATIDLLKDTFGDRLISRFGPVNWPPRSCDLTPLGYFL
ncbi:transposable element Tc3 transposase [Trichonephila clavipes]|nr:transposable element Tc3 transposase [Trichonephila clavipes]